MLSLKQAPAYPQPTSPSANTAIMATSLFPLFLIFLLPEKWLCLLIYPIIWDEASFRCNLKSVFLLILGPCSKLETNIPRKGIARPQSRFPHSCVCERLYISTIALPILLQEVCGPILGIYKSLTDTWMWKLGLRPHKPELNTSMEYLLQCMLPDFTVVFLLILGPHCKEPIPKIKNKYSRKGFARPQSQFPHSCVCEQLYISTIALPILLQEVCGPILGIYI